VTIIAAILITWYATKVYYTRSTGLKLTKFDTENMVHLPCSKCALVTTVREDQLRTPFYCSSCK